MHSIKAKEENYCAMNKMKNQEPTSDICAEETSKEGLHVYLKSTLSFR